MRKISQDEFFANYPNYSNSEELKKADILIMPSYIEHGFYAFIGDQSDFRDVSNDYAVNCLFYSEDQNVLSTYRELSESVFNDPVIIYGTILTTVGVLLNFYQILKNKTGGKKFRLKQIIFKNNEYFETEFEGDIKQYKELIDKIRVFIEEHNK